MQAFFKSELDYNEIEKIREFCNSVDYCSIEQSIGWINMLYKTKICYFYLTDGSEIKSFSQITQNFKSAHVDFGPVCCDKEIMIISINEIIKYYKKLGYYFLGIQMYYKSGYDTEYIEYALNKVHKIKYIFNNENTKSSIEIDLENSIEEIYSKITKGHKSDIKRAVKLGLTVDRVKNTDELNIFFGLYSKMCKARNIDESELSAKNINEIYNYLIKYNKGQILCVKDKDSIILGGAILLYQGKSVRYFKGASDPDRRDIPITHILLYEAINQSRNNNYKYFDFWGFNHFADEDNQVYYINRFKKGFGGYYTFFAKKMNIDLIPFGNYLFKVYLFIRELKNKTKRKFV